MSEELKVDAAHWDALVKRWSMLSAPKLRELDRIGLKLAGVGPKLDPSNVLPFQKKAKAPTGRP